MLWRFCWVIVIYGVCLLSLFVWVCYLVLCLLGLDFLVCLVLLLGWLPVWFLLMYNVVYHCFNSRFAISSFEFAISFDVCLFCWFWFAWLLLVVHLYFCLLSFGFVVLLFLGFVLGSLLILWLVWLPLFVFCCWFVCLICWFDLLLLCVLLCVIDLAILGWLRFLGLICVSNLLVGFACNCNTLHVLLCAWVVWLANCYVCCLPTLNYLIT